MVKRFLEEGKSFFFSKQSNILSAAFIIMIMTLASRVLGLIRYRTLAHFFDPTRIDVFLAGFQLSDLIFEVMIMGAMSSAFIPVFSGFIVKNKEKEAWRVAALTLNSLLFLFFILGAFIFLFANPIYAAIAKGYSLQQINEIASYTRILLLAQMFFVASYVLTAILEANHRFLVSATAPLFYNISIIATTYLLAPQIGILAPVIGAVIGAFLHLLIQLPVALKLGFRPVFDINFTDPGVRRVARLALPRVLELSIFQIKRLTDLFVVSLIAGGLTYFRFGDALAAIPSGLFGLSIAKASLPKLAEQAHEGTLENFKATFIGSFRQILFLVIPASIFISVLRIPLVRLAFGDVHFLWDDTVRTGYVVSAFAIGIFAYALSLLTSRAFYALEDTTTPVKITVFTVLMNAVLGVGFVLGLQRDVWLLALAYSISQIFSLSAMFIILSRKIGGFAGYGLGKTFIKIVIAASGAGGVMFVLLKLLDRTAWDKKLSFLAHVGLALPTTFEKFVLDTKYVRELIILTGADLIIGFCIFLALAKLLKIEELNVVIKLLLKLDRFGLAHKIFPVSKTETITPPPQNGIS